MATEQASKRSAAIGALAGVVAFLVGYVITYLWRGRDIEESLQPMEALLQLFEAEPIGTWRAVGWLFYNGHFVDTRVSSEIGVIETVAYVNFVAEGAGNIELLYLVPPVLLLLAGALLAWYVDVDEPVDGAASGAAVVLGYLPVIAIGLIAFAYNSTRPDPVPAIVLAGIVYPVVFGAIGGAIRGFLNSNAR